jgi:hypothetical protein
VLSFVPGDVPREPLPPEATGEDVLAELARLVRSLHDASQGWTPPRDAVWGGNPRAEEEPELVAHRRLITARLTAGLRPARSGRGQEPAASPAGTSHAPARNQPHPPRNQRQGSSPLVVERHSGHRVKGWEEVGMTDSPQSGSNPGVFGDPEPDEAGTDVLGGAETGPGVLGGPEPDEAGTDVLGGAETGPGVLGGPEPDEAGTDVLGGPS